VANVLCFDFDDTIVLDNTMRQVLERFGAPGWRDFEAAYHRHEMSVEQFNAAAFDTVEPSISREEMEQFVRESARLREGFLELLDWAAWNDWQCAVVSNGLDLYVDAVLDSLGVDRVVRHAGRTARTYRWRVKYLSPRGMELASGFKLAYAQAYKNAGDFVAYLGDGASDVPAAKLAPVVFARSTLLERLSEHPKVHPFETFHDVRKVMEREGAGWGVS
jgi:2-hydroxy-3-keto-5-methylthiopentenyl-1-phosphate phosphatase